MALSVGPRVSCLLLQILSNTLDGVALVLFLSLWFFFPFYVWTLNHTCETLCQALTKCSLHKSLGVLHHVVILPMRQIGHWRLRSPQGCCSTFLPPQVRQEPCLSSLMQLSSLPWIASIMMVTLRAYESTTLKRWRNHLQSGKQPRD